MSDEQRVEVSSWWGRRSADSATIHCAQNGWREAVWERDDEGVWQEIAATLSPVIGIRHDGSAILGEKRSVR
jgi:hypothetical protein